MLSAKYGFGPSWDFAAQTSDPSYGAIILGLRTQTSDPRICCTNLRSVDLLRKPQIHTQSSRIAQSNPGHPCQQTHDRLRKRSSSAIHRNEATTDRARKAVRPSAAKSHERSHSKAAHPSAATKHNRSRSRAHTLRLCRQRWLTIVGSLPRMAELLCERYRSWVCCRGWPRFGCAILDDCV